MTVRMSEQRTNRSVALSLEQRRSDAPETRSAPVVVRLPLPPVSERPEVERPLVCDQCGSRGFNVHQRTWRTVRDPQVKRIQVSRFVCKRCGATCRVYPTGIGPERQSAAVKQISVFLYCLGLTYRAVQQVLSDLDSPLSMTTIRQDVLSACAGHDSMRPFERLRLNNTSSGWLEGPDGRMAVRLIGTAPARRWLELEVQDAPGGAELTWRAQACTRQLTLRAVPTEF